MHTRTCIHVTPQSYFDAFTALQAPRPCPATQQPSSMHLYPRLLESKTTRTGAATMCTIPQLAAAGGRTVRVPSATSPPLPSTPSLPAARFQWLGVQMEEEVARLAGR